MTTTFKMSDGDLFFDINGRLEYVEGFEKVSQDMAEVLLTNFDVDRNYGTELVLVDSSPVFNISQSQVTLYVTDAIERLRNLQRTSSYTTLQEEIASIESIEVFKNDQTEILFGVAVRTSSGPSINTAINMAQKPVSLQHLMPPSTSEQIQEYEARARDATPIITGEVSNG